MTWRRHLLLRVEKEEPLTVTSSTINSSDLSIEGIGAQPHPQFVEVLGGAALGGAGHGAGPHGQSNEKLKHRTDGSLGHGTLT